jgi:tetratricopeptide (TPR) repeat protein
VIYRLLGDLSVGSGDERLDLPGGHALRVLATLLISANRHVSKEDLLRASWGRTDINDIQLHKAVSAVRLLLGRVDRRQDLRTHSRLGYELKVRDEDLDMLRFLQLVRQAENAAARSEDHEVELLRQSLQLWRGPWPLANVPMDALRTEVEQLRQRRKRAAVRLFEIEIRSGHVDTVLDELSTMASHYPTDRRLCELLLVALFYSGSATEALHVYDRYAADLDQETGGIPDAGLKRLRYAIASDNAALVDECVGATSARGTQATPAPVPRELPVAPPDFVGRDPLVAEARWLLGRHSEAQPPVIVISGPGGIGKSALAVHIARLVGDDYPDGQIYIELRATAGQRIEPEDVLAQALRSLGASAMPATRAERAKLYRSLVDGRRILVVLDDVDDEDQVSDLVPGDPRCGVLLTARHQLPLLTGAMHLPPLEPLDGSVATEMFRQLIRRANLNPPDDVTAIERIVALCAGLPLAIRIAAALLVRERGRTAAELADRLAQQGPAGFQYRELSMARSIGASFDRLDPAAQRLFLGLALARLPDFGRWTAAAVLEVTGTDDGGADAMGALSQVVEAFVGHPLDPPQRFQLHDLTQDYAYRRAVATGPDEGPAVAARVYRALLTLVRRAHRGIYGGDYEVVHSDEPDWDAPTAVLREVDEAPLAWLNAERRNIASAVSHCAALGLTDLCWDLAISSHEYYTLSGHFDDWYATHTEALAACRDAGDRRGEGIVLTVLGQPALIASRQGGNLSGPEELRRAVDLLAECGDQHGQAIALRTLANALRRRGQLTEPLELFLAALGHYEASGDTLGMWLTLRFVGQTHLDLGHHAEALQVLASARAAAQRLGRPRLLAQTRYWIGQVGLGIGDLDGAEAEFRAVLDTFPEPSGPGHAYAQHGLGDVARQRRDLALADEHLDQAARIARESSDAVLEGRAHRSLADVRLDQGQVEAAVAALEYAAECFADAGAPYYQAGALAALAELHTKRGEQAKARRVWDRVRHLYAEMDLPPEDQIHRPTPSPGR